MAVRQKMDRKQMAAYSTVRMEFIDSFDSDFQRLVGDVLDNDAACSMQPFEE
jgi:hypothetical protein